LELAYTLRVVRNLVGQGFPLSQAMGRFPETFDGVILTIVGYGEIYSGSDRTLRRYADRPEDLCPR
jgi:type II secretory pathway component PulF